MSSRKGVFAVNAELTGVCRRETAALALSRVLDPVGPARVGASGWSGRSPAVAMRRDALTELLVTDWGAAGGPAWTLVLPLPHLLNTGPIF